MTLGSTLTMISLALPISVKILFYNIASPSQVFIERYSPDEFLRFPLDYVTQKGNSVLKNDASHQFSGTVISNSELLVNLAPLPCYPCLLYTR